ncbi:MAG: PTS sugar transporter subunit IIB [Streptococcaceae bacterium]|jgi:PTS system mannose-specific IIB component|nr:PTS sugar transporter subunit IIB [Streptococcaceae bacterium]
MPITLARIDQRLVHGITVNDWNTLLKPKRFMVIDDQLSSDEIAKGAMRMSKPAGTGMSIISLETAVRNFKAEKYDDHKVFLLVKEPETLVKLVEAGITIPEINVGFLFPEGRVAVTERAALNAKEVSDLKELQDNEINVSFQYRPSDTKITLEKAIAGKDF